MKKSIAIVLLLSHVFSAMGFSLHIHYCGKNKTYSAFGLSVGKHCACKHKDQIKRDKCCKERKVAIQSIKKESLSRYVWVFKSNPAVAAVAYSPQWGMAEVFDFQALHHVTEHPPDATEPVYLLNRVLLI